MVLGSIAEFILGNTFPFVVFGTMIALISYEGLCIRVEIFHKMILYRSSHKL